MMSNSPLSICQERQYDVATGAVLLDLARRQQVFAEALLNPTLPIPPGLVGPDGLPVTKRFDVYRNNVVAGLVTTLKDAFPAVARIVGDVFFAAMTRIYVVANPPHSPVMLDYGKGFSSFIGAFEPASLSLPYLHDVARLERAWLEAYHASEAEPIAAGSLPVSSAEELMKLRVTLHPSLRLIRSTFPVLTIWQTNIASGIPTRVELNKNGQDVLINRPVAEVEVHELPPGSAVFIDMLSSGMCVLEAMEQALLVNPHFDLPLSLSGLLEVGAFIGFKPEPSLETK